MASFPMDTANYPVDDEPISYHDDHSEAEWEGAIREANDATIAVPILGRPYSETVDMSSSSRDPSVGGDQRQAQYRNNDDDGQFSIDTSLEDALNMSVSSVDLADFNGSADDVFAQRLESLKAKEADVTPAADYHKKSIKCIKTHYSFSESSHRSKEEGDRIAEAEASRFAGGAIIEAPVEFIDTASTSSDDDDDDKSAALRAELERQLENDQPIVVVDTDLQPTDRANSLYSDSESENGSKRQPKAKSQKSDSSHKRLKNQFFTYGRVAEPTAAQLEEPNVDNDSDDSFEDAVAATQQKRQKMVVNADRIMKKASIHCEEDDSPTEEEIKASPVRSRAGTRNQRRRAKAAPVQEDAPMQSDDDNDDDSFEDRVKATNLRGVPSISQTKKKKSKRSSRQPLSQRQQQEDKVEKVKPFTGRLVEEAQDAKEDEDSDASSDNVDDVSDDSFEERVKATNQRRSLSISPTKKGKPKSSSRKPLSQQQQQQDKVEKVKPFTGLVEDTKQDEDSDASSVNVDEASDDSFEERVRLHQQRRARRVEASSPKPKHRVGKSRRSRRSTTNQPDESAELFTGAVAAKDSDEIGSSSGSDGRMSESSADSFEDQVRVMDGRSAAAAASPRNNKSVRKKKKHSRTVKSKLHDVAPFAGTEKITEENDTVEGNSDLDDEHSEDDTFEDQVQSLNRRSAHTEMTAVSPSKSNKKSSRQSRRSKHGSGELFSGTIPGKATEDDDNEEEEDSSLMSDEGDEGNHSQDQRQQGMNQRGAPAVSATIRASRTKGRGASHRTRARGRRGYTKGDAFSVASTAVSEPQNEDQDNDTAINDNGDSDFEDQVESVAVARRSAPGGVTTSPGRRRVDNNSRRVTNRGAARRRKPQAEGKVNSPSHRTKQSPRRKTTQAVNSAALASLYAGDVGTKEEHSDREDDDSFEDQAQSLSQHSATIAAFDDASTSNHENDEEQVQNVSHRSAADRSNADAQAEHESKQVQQNAEGTSSENIDDGSISDQDNDSENNVQTLDSPCSPIIPIVLADRTMCYPPDPPDQFQGSNNGWDREISSNFEVNAPLSDDDDNSKESAEESESRCVPMVPIVVADFSNRDPPDEHESSQVEESTSSSERTGGAALSDHNGDNEIEKEEALSNDEKEVRAAVPAESPLKKFAKRFFGFGKTQDQEPTVDLGQMEKAVALEDRSQHSSDSNSRESISSAALSDDEEQARSIPIVPFTASSDHSKSASPEIEHEETGESENNSEGSGSDVSEDELDDSGSSSSSLNDEEQDINQQSTYVNPFPIFDSNDRTPDFNGSENDPEYAQRTGQPASSSSSGSICASNENIDNVKPKVLQDAVWVGGVDDDIEAQQYDSKGEDEIFYVEGEQPGGNDSGHDSLNDVLNVVASYNDDQSFSDEYSAKKTAPPSNAVRSRDRNATLVSDKEQDKDNDNKMNPTTNALVVDKNKDRDKRKGRQRCIGFIVLAAFLVNVAAGLLAVWLMFLKGDHSGNGTVTTSTFDGNDILDTPPPISATSPAPSPTDGPTEQPLLTGCNGLENLCDVRVNEVLFAVVHNAASTVADGFALANHKWPLEQALDAGYRGINLDIGKCGDDGELRLVHSNCALGSRDPIEVFTNIMTFLEDNPNEILIMPTQIENGSGGPVTAEEIGEMFLKVPGLTLMLYAHPGPSTPWPTLQELINRNKRIIFFHYDGENCADPQVTCHPGFNDYWQYATETTFELDSIETIQDARVSCELTRGLDGEKDFFGINVFTTTPDADDSCSIVNDEFFLEKHLEDCSSFNSLKPNLLLVDCWETGDVVATVRKHNAALTATSAVAADVDLELRGLSTLLIGSNLSVFIEICSLFFDDKLDSDFSDIECQVITQTPDNPNGEQQLQVLVRVSGDSTNPAKDLDRSALESVIGESGGELKIRLWDASTFFVSIKNIYVVGAGPVSTAPPVIDEATAMPTGGSVALEPPRSISTEAPSAEATGGSVVLLPP